MLKTINVILPEDTHVKFKGKCKYYSMTMQEVAADLIQRFTDSKDFDELFDLPEDIREGTK